MNVFNSDGATTGVHRVIFNMFFDILQDQNQVDGLILPDFSEGSIRNLFTLMYDPDHRWFECLRWPYQIFSSVNLTCPAEKEELLSLQGCLGLRSKSLGSSTGLFWLDPIRLIVTFLLRGQWVCKGASFSHDCLGNWQQTYDNASTHYF